MPSHSRRHRRVWLLLALAILAVAGCSKTPNKPKPPPTISQADADDLAQLIAATVAANSGGWYFTVKTLAESLAVPPADDTSSAGRGSATFPITKGPNTYQFQMTYNEFQNSLQVGYPTRDSASFELEATVHGNGGRVFVAIAADTVNGTYGFHCPDGNFSVFGLRSEHDTLSFSNIVDPDSSFALVSSSRHGTRRWWYLPDNYFDFELLIPKSKLLTNPYPVSGEVNWIIEAYVMPGDTTRDEIHSAISDVLAEGQITFNGTPIVPFRIVDILSEASYEYRYTINLDTGEFTPVGGATPTRAVRADARAGFASRRAEAEARIAARRAARLLH